MPVSGDLVRMRMGYSPVGMVIEQVVTGVPSSCRYVFVLWPDAGKSLEKIRDLVVVNEVRDD